MSSLISISISPTILIILVSMADITISTVTPVYNGAKYLEKLVGELAAFKDHLEANYPKIRMVESIFVLDEPKDNSAELLYELRKSNQWITVLELSRNFGQHPATICGVLHSSADWVVTLDEDLQHKPNNIIDLLKQVAPASSDICYANPESLTHKSVIKDFLARSFKRFMTSILSNENIEYFNSFRLIRGDIARAAAAICRHETYYDIALGWFTKRVTNTRLSLIDERNINNVEDSGYSFWGLVRHAKRMFMSSRVKIFRVGIPLGLIAFGISIALSIYAVSATLMKWDTVLNKGWTSTILTVLFFGGLTVLLISFILETISDIVLSVNGKPTFFVVDRSKDDILRSGINH